MYSKKQLLLLRTLFFRRVNHRPFIRLTKGETTHVFNTIYQCAEYLSAGPEHVWSHFVTRFPLDGWVIDHIKHNDPEAVEIKSYQSSRRPPDESGIRIKRPVKVYDIVTHKVERFASLSACGKHYGARASHVRLRISVPEKVRLLYQRFIIIDDNRSFHFLTTAVLKSLINRINHGIVVFNGQQNKIAQFSGITAFMRLSKKEKDIENATRQLNQKGIYTVSKDQFIMKATADILALTEKEIIQLFLEKINEIYTYQYQNEKRTPHVQ